MSDKEDCIEIKLDSVCEEIESSRQVEESLADKIHELREEGYEEFRLVLSPEEYSEFRKLHDDCGMYLVDYIISLTDVDIVVEAEDLKINYDPAQAFEDHAIWGPEGWLEEGPDRCVWKYDRFTDSHSTSCDENFQFTNGGPKENNFKFCPYCGDPILLNRSPSSYNANE